MLDKLVLDVNYIQLIVGFVRCNNSIVVCKEISFSEGQCMQRHLGVGFYDITYFEII